MKGYKALRDTQANTPIEVYTKAGKEFPTPNRMPSEVSILGQHFQIRYHSLIYSEPNKNSRLSGVVIYNHRLIIIDPTQSIHSMRETLYHEIGHVYLKCWQMKSESLSKLTPAQVEEVCDMFGESVYDLASNNPIAK